MHREGSAASAEASGEGTPRVGWSDRRSRAAQVCAVSAADFQQLDRDGKRYRTAREINLLGKTSAAVVVTTTALHPGLPDA